MIVYSNAALLESDSGIPLANARILHQNLARDLAASSVFASTEDATGPRDAVLRPDTGEYWLPTAMPATLRIDLGSLKPINAVGVVGTFGSSVCACKVETSPDNAVYTILGAEIIPPDDMAMLFIDTLRSARHIRLTATGAVPPRVAVVQPGKALAMQKQVSGPYKPISMARKTIRRQSMSRTGQFLGQTFMRNGIASTASFKNLDDVWVRANFNAFSLDARRFPYFFAWNPSLFLPECAYVWTEEDIVPEYSGQIALMNVSWSMDGIGAP